MDVQLAVELQIVAEPVFGRPAEIVDQNLAENMAIRAVVDKLGSQRTILEEPSDGFNKYYSVTLRTCKMFSELARHWDEDSNFPSKDWRREVSEDNTRQSYKRWVESQYEFERDEEGGEEVDEEDYEKDEEIEELTEEPTPWFVMRNEQPPSGISVQFKRLDGLLIRGRTVRFYVPNHYGKSIAVYSGDNLYMPEHIRCWRRSALVR